MLNILIIEDSGERLEFFRDLYQHHNVFVASNSNDAIDHLKLTSFDIIHLDYMLENEDTSYRAAKYIKENKLEALIIIHSTHPSGAGRLNKLLPQAHRIPFYKFKGTGEFAERVRDVFSNKELPDIEYLVKLFII
ncbi:MAG: response regulator [candidate division Zixibacteria bacterium]|nr:response regulator [candidate division Zixibacteria bacterium]